MSHIKCLDGFLVVVAMILLACSPCIDCWPTRAGEEKSQVIQIEDAELDLNFTVAPRDHKWQYRVPPGRMELRYMGSAGNGSVSSANSSGSRAQVIWILAGCTMLIYCCCCFICAHFCADRCNQMPDEWYSRAELARRNHDAEKGRAMMSVIVTSSKQKQTKTSKQSLPPASADAVSTAASSRSPKPSQSGTKTAVALIKPKTGATGKVGRGSREKKSLPSVQKSK